MKSHKKKQLNRRGSAALCTGRDERIRTSDHLNPIQVRYQTALHPVYFVYHTQRLFTAYAAWHGLQKTSCLYGLFFLWRQPRSERIQAKNHFLPSRS